jgi:hypothetical protein
MVQIVFWVMGQRVSPEPIKPWEYIAGPFNTFQLAQAHIDGWFQDGVVRGPRGYCVITIQEKRVWRS